MAKKYYAVKKGLTPGIYMSWPDCQAQINGYSGAIYKGFATKEEALEFMGGEAEVFGEAEQMTLSFMNIEEASDTKPVSTKIAKEVLPNAETEAVAYVDGSYDVTTGSFSYGMVMFHDGKEEHFSKRFDNSDLASMRNVAGEIEGARAAMQYCLDHGIKSLTIYHDYIGIAAWCTGEWKAKQEGTMDYALFYRAASLHVDIAFQKVKGHSGDTYNELADKLAKEALGI
ncbi:MAG: ribonuclease H family protein [Lachnospiraceae bacterium]|nr:ribonuclease H family protein [Lachnospiraceae bacterium]